MEYVPTPSATVGPFLHIGLTSKHSFTRIAGPNTTGERVCLKCRVFDGEGAPVDDAMLEIWQANSQGRYNHPDDLQAKTLDADFHGFGRAATDEAGSCEFETIKPGCVPGAQNTVQAPHLNLALYARGILLQLYTRIYFAGDPRNEQDPVLARVPEERRDTLMARADPARSGQWWFDIRLRGEQETVFFDL